MWRGRMPAMQPVKAQQLDERGRANLGRVRSAAFRGWQRQLRVDRVGDERVHATLD
jgi:hypothetical protein